MRFSVQPAKNGYILSIHKDEPTGYAGKIPFGHVETIEQHVAKDKQELMHLLETLIK